MKFKDYYKILELETSRVTIDQIKAAYRKQAKKFHPDVNVGNKLAEEKIKDINEAYKVLSDSTSKRKYDRTWNYNVGNKQKKAKQKTSGEMAGDFFNMFFGNNQAKEEIEQSKLPPQKGENIETAINISIEEGFYGVDKKIVLKDIEGKDKAITVQVPEGIKNGEQIRIIGQGKEGTNGGNPGDLLIKVIIKNDNKFRLEGYDLYTDLYLTPWEAALGTRVSIETIDEETKIYIPQGIQSGERIRIPNKGYKADKNTRGDLVAEIKIVVPKKLTEEEKEIFNKLKKISKFNPRNKK